MTNKLDEVFDTLKNKALIEDCTVNIDHDTIWLHGTGVGFSVEDGYLYVRERGVFDDFIKIPKWKLPKRSFFSNKTRDYEKEFKALVELLVLKKEKVRKEARKLAEETMQQEANDTIIKKLGL